MLYSSTVGELSLANIFFHYIWELMSDDATFLHPVTEVLPIIF